MTLSRVVVFPEKLMRSTKYCLSSSMSGQIDELLLFIKILLGSGSEVDEAEPAVTFLDTFDASAQQRSRYRHRPFSKSEGLLDFRWQGGDASNLDVANVVLAVLLDLKTDMKTRRLLGPERNRNTPGRMAA